jgi:HSP20 family protein
MANLVKRENRGVDVARRGGSEYRWDPLRVIDTLLRGDPFRDEFGPLASWGGGYAPRFDVKETKDAYVIKADLPGVKEEEVDVSLSGNMLTISGKKEEEHKEEGEQYYAMERTYGSFARSFSLPDSVDSEHVTAELRDGVLAVNVPKRPEAQPKKISIGKGGGEATAKA